MQWQWQILSLINTINMIRLTYLLIPFIVLIASCSSREEDPKENDKQADNPNELVNEFEGVEILFDDTEFEYPNAIDILKEINICSTEKQDSLGIPQTQCTPDNFKFFPLRKNMGIQDGFLLVIKAQVGGIQVRRILVFERENGELVKTNGFIANLVGFREKQEGPADLLLRFIDKDPVGDYYYNCSFVWKDGKYEYDGLEVISQPTQNFSRTIKPEFKDSMSKEIYAIIDGNNMIF